MNRLMWYLINSRKYHQQIWILRKKREKAKSNSKSLMNHKNNVILMDLSLTIKGRTKIEDKSKKIIMKNMMLFQRPRKLKRLILINTKKIIWRLNLMISHKSNKMNLQVQWLQKRWRKMPKIWAILTKTN